MGDMGELFRDMKEARRALRNKFGIDCPKCKELQPKRNPSILLPGQRCKVDKYRDPRQRLTIEQRNEAYKEAGLDMQEVWAGGHPDRSTPVKP